MTHHTLKLIVVALMLALGGCASVDEGWPARYAAVMEKAREGCAAGLATLATGALSRDEVAKNFEEGARLAAQWDVYSILRPAVPGQIELIAARNAVCGQLKEALK